MQELLWPRFHVTNSWWSGDEEYEEEAKKWDAQLRLNEELSFAVVSKLSILHLTFD